MASPRKKCWVPGHSLKPCMDGTCCERGNPENTGGLTERRETSPRWVNPGLPIWVNADPRPKPPVREPKEPILCAEQGISQTRIKIPMMGQIRGGILHLPWDKFYLVQA
jgi:hypothetical protein